MSQSNVPSSKKTCGLFTPLLLWRWSESDEYMRKAQRLTIEVYTRFEVFLACQVTTRFRVKARVDEVLFCLLWPNGRKIGLLQDGQNMNQRIC